MDKPATPPAPVDPEQVVASAWADQTLWSQVANQLGESIRNWRLAAAVAGVLGVFLSVLVGSLRPDQLGGTKGQTALATLGVLLLALVPYLRQQLLSADRVLAWTRARNVAEQLKEAIYRHLMGALPPVALADGSPAPDPSGPGNLVRRCRAIKQGAADLALLAASTNPEPRQRKTRMVLADYLADRLEGQIGWYRKASLASGASATRLQRAEFALGLLTVVLGALAGKLLPSEVTPELAQRALQVSPLVPWLALIAAAAAAVSSHIAGTRHLELASKYFATHDLLKTLRDEWLVSPDRDEPMRALRLVDDVERAIAIEHGGWVTDWQQAMQGARSPTQVALVAAGSTVLATTVVDAAAEVPADMHAEMPAEVPAQVPAEVPAEASTDSHAAPGDQPTADPATAPDPSALADAEAPRSARLPDDDPAPATGLSPEAKRPFD